MLQSVRQLTRHIYITINQDLSNPVRRGMCLVDAISPGADLIPKIHVYYNKELKQLHLSHSSVQECLQSQHQFFKNIRHCELALEHVKDCEAKALQNINFKFRNEFQPLRKHINLAGCAVVLSKDQKVLLTKRTSALGSYPGAWVMPGGGINNGEELATGAIRETFEETGISIVRFERRFFHQSQPCTISPFYLHEAAFRSTNYITFLRTHHLIIFFLVQLGINSENIPLELENNEVETGAWVPLKQIKEILEHRPGVVEEVYPNIPGRVVENCELFPPYKNELGSGLGMAHAKVLQHLLQFHISSLL